MCKSRMQIDDLLDMITSISEKKARIQGNLRLEALLKCTYKWLDNELKVRQLSRKRKWIENTVDSKKSKSGDDVVPMEEDTDDDILAIETSLLSVLSILRSNNCV